MVEYSHQGVVNTGMYIGNWEDERPKGWRQQIARLAPNGMMPVLGLTSKAPTEKTEDPQFHWWEEDYPTGRAAITGVYTDAAMTTAYASGAVAGTTLYVKFTDNADGQYTKQFRAGQTVLLLYTSDYNVFKRGIIQTVHSVSTTVGMVSVKLLQADNTSGNKIASADVIRLVGNANAENAERPDSIVLRPYKYSNYTQIWRNSIELSRTVKKTKLRTEPAYQRAKANGLMFHGLDMERSLLFGIPYEGTGSNGMPLRTTMGLMYFFETYAKDTDGTPIGVQDYANTTTFEGYTFTGKDWTDVEGGELWLDAVFEHLFRYGRNEKLAVCGSGAIMGINRIAKQRGDFMITSKTVAWGTKVVEWVTPFGVVYLKTHPLFSQNPEFRHSMLVFEPQNMRFRTIDDTFFKSDDSERKSDSDGKDGTAEEWLTEGGWEFVHPKTGRILHNVGKNNTLAA